MKITRLSNIKKTFFSKNDLVDTLGVNEYSASVIASRYVKAGLFVRAARDIYILRERLGNLNESELFMLANRIQVPSYISFTTALSFYGITTQLQHGYIESAAILRSKKITIEDLTFDYFKLKKDLYSGFEKKDGFFIAIPEKALLDSIYLASLKRYQLDISALNTEKINKKVVRKLIAKYPQKTKKLLEKVYERSSKT